MAKGLKQFDRWAEQLMPGLVHARPAWRRLGAPVGLVLLVGVVAVVVVWQALGPSPAPIAIVELHLEPVQSDPTLVFSAASSAIDTRRVRRLTAYFLTDPSTGLKPIHAQVLYDAPSPVPRAEGGLVTLAELGAPGASPFSPPAAVQEAGLYQLVLEAERFDAEAGVAPARFFAQPNFRKLERRDRPWPVWIRSPRQDAVLKSPFPVTGQAYEDGFLQLRTKPKLWQMYYQKGNVAMALKAGKEFTIRVAEGGTQAFELYALFAKKAEYLPQADAIQALPRGTGRVEIIGPIDFFVRQLHGPVRSDEQMRKDLDLAKTISARFTVPDQAAKRPLAVKWRHKCGGTVSPQAEKLGLRYVLGVRPMYPLRERPRQKPRFVKAKPGEGVGHHVWIQSSPWRTKNCRFRDKLVKFGIEHEVYAYAFELWLIAVRPGATVELEEYQPWLASALPEGCVRAASMIVAKPLEQPKGAVTAPTRSGGDRR